MFSQSQKLLAILVFLVVLTPLTAGAYLKKTVRQLIFKTPEISAKTANTGVENPGRRSQFIPPLPPPIYPPPSFPKPPPPAPEYKKFDVVIYGDELPGICAAIWAKKTLGKNGKVILVRSNSADAPLGGLLTRGGLAYLDYDKTPGWYYRPYSRCFINFTRKARVIRACVEPNRAAKAMKNMLYAAGVYLLSNAEVTPYIEKGKIKFVGINRTNMRIKAEAFIDTTQDAELGRKAGLSYYRGFEAQDPKLKNETMALSIVPTLEGLTIYQFRRIEAKILYNRRLMGEIRADIRRHQTPPSAKFILKNFRLPLIKTYNDAYMNRSIALGGAYHLHRNIPFSFESSFLFDKLNICRLGRRSLSLNGLLFKSPVDEIREMERDGFRGTEGAIAEIQALETWLREMSDKSSIKLTLPEEVYIRHSLNIRDVVAPLTGLEVIKGGTAPENSIGTFSYDFDFRGGVNGLSVESLPVPRFNFGIESGLAKNVNNLAIVGRSSGYVGIAAAVGRIQTVNVYQGQGMGVAAALAIKSGVPLNQITSAEVRKKLESLTGRKTRLRGRDRSGGRDYSRVK